MKHSKIRQYLALSLLLVVPTLVLSCGDDDDDDQRPPATPGDGGEAGMPASEASNAGAAGMSGGASDGVTVCGNKSDVSECDPVVAAGCDVASRETCDYSTMLGGFMCFTDSLASAGEYCDNLEVFCGAGSVCNQFLGVCQHFCCVNLDCAEGACERHVYNDGAADIGVCTAEFGGRCAFDLGGAGGACPTEGGAGQGGGSDGGAAGLGGGGGAGGIP